MELASEHLAGYNSEGGQRKLFVLARHCLEHVENDMEGEDLQFGEQDEVEER
jgi:hypothetical protein